MKYPITEGHAEFNDDGVEISDKVRLGAKFEIGFALILLIVGIIHTTKWILRDQVNVPYISFFVLITAVLILLNKRRFTLNSEIKYEEIKNVKFIRRWGNQWTDIVLNNGKIRRVVNMTTTFNKVLIEKMEGKSPLEYS